MDTRNAFFNFVCEKNYEFSSVRSAKFSTMALLYELHISIAEKFTYNYNRCQQQCGIFLLLYISSIVDMKQSYEQSSLNSTDLKSEIEKQQATCLQADRRYMEAMTMSQEKNIMQV
ncbi:unnamed protein product, partial [Rotaria sp. Silwood2]